MAIGAGFSLIATVLFIYLYAKYVILKSQTSIEIQNVLKFYILVEILNGSVVCFNLIHSCVVYKIRDTSVYATPLLFWDAAVENITTIIRPIAILTLGLDRILIIILRTTSQRRRQIYSFSIGTSLMIAASTVIFVMRILPNILTESFITSCVTLVCLGKMGSSSIFIALKMVFGGANLVLGIILIFILKKRCKTVIFIMMKNKNIMLVIITLFLTIFLDFVPNLSGFLFFVVGF